MVIPITVFLCFLLSCEVFTPAIVEAANRRVLLQLSNLQQWADVGVRYSGAESDGGGSSGSSQSLSFEESYNLNIDYAILNKRLVNGTLELSIGSDQNFQWQSSAQGDGSSAGYRLEYFTDLFMFERRPYPILVTSSRYQELIAQPFSDDYDLVTSSFLSRISLLNDFVPIDISYTRSESETSGLLVDRSQLFELFAIGVNQDIKDFSSTRLRMQTGSGKTELSGGGGEKNEAYELEASNRLAWDFRSEESSLISSYRVREESGDSELSVLSWSERLNLRLGKALKTGYAYNYSKSISEFNDRRDTRQTGWLEHQLYESLTSRFNYEQQHLEEEAGIVDSWSRSGNFNYSKSLPKQSRLNLSYGHTYGIVDSDLNVEVRSVVGETLNASASVVENDLRSQDVILDDTLRVYKVDPITGLRTLLDLGTNYEIITIGRFTYLDFFSPGLAGVIVGDTVSVDYSYQADGSIEYSTTSNMFSMSVSLFNNRYKVYSNAAFSEQELIAGEAEVTSLGESFVFAIGLDGDLKDYRFGTKYSLTEFRDSREKIFNAYLLFHKSSGITDISLRLDEQYSHITQNQSLALAQELTSQTNYLALSYDYKKNYGRNLKLKYSASLTDLRGDIKTQNELKFGFNGEYRWYKFLAFLDTSVTWQLSDQVTRRNDRLSLTLRRYF